MIQVCTRVGNTQMLRLEPAFCEIANPHGACRYFRAKYFLRARMMLRLFWESVWKRGYST